MSRILFDFFDGGVIHSPGPVTFSGVTTSIVPAAPTLIPAAGTPIVYRRDFNSYRGATRRRYNGGSGA